MKDITGDIGGLSSGANNPMASFERVAFMFWQGFYNGLREKGLTHKQAMTELSSTGTRHMLDENEDQTNKIGNLGKQMGLKYRPVCHAVRE